MAEKRLTGRIAAEHIKLHGRCRARRRAWSSASRRSAIRPASSPTPWTSSASRAASIGASVLRPTMPGTTMVGPALTLRNILQRIDPLEGARDKVNKMAEFECHNLAHARRRAGDRGRRRRVQHGRHLGADRQAPGRGRRDRARRHPRRRAIRARSAIRSGRATSRRSPASGGSKPPRSTAPIQIGDVKVSPGDLVVADDTGVCFIPRDRIMEVLEARREEGQGGRRPLQGDRRRHSGAGYFKGDIRGEVRRTSAAHAALVHTPNGI